MSEKSRLTAILVVSIFGFLDGVNAEVHEETVLKDQRNQSMGLIDGKLETFNPYTGNQVTCVDVSEDAGAHNCCEALKACTEVIPPGRTKYGIENPTTENLYGCGCSLRFRSCLQEADDKNPSSVYEELGRTYFDTKPLRKCFHLLPSVTCDGSFYDRNGKPHDENPREYFFCPKVRNNKMYYERFNTA